MQVVLDGKGKKTSVIIPFKEWEKLSSDFTKLQNKLKVLTGIKEGLQEIREANRSGKKLKSLSEAINEI